MNELFGTIRDPWTWYVSLFNHAKRSVQGKEAIRRHGGTFRGFLEVMARKGITDHNYTLISVRSDEHIWKDYPHGLYSHWFEIFYMPHTRVFLDTAQLRKGVKEFLGLKAQFDVINKTTTGDHRDYYDDDLIDLVWATDGELARKLGFTPFSKSSKGAVIRLD